MILRDSEPELVEHFAGAAQPFRTWFTKRLPIRLASVETRLVSAFAPQKHVLSRSERRLYPRLAYLRVGLESPTYMDGVTRHCPASMTQSP
jgi:hypothetical protein